MITGTHWGAARASRSPRREACSRVRFVMNEIFMHVMDHGPMCPHARHHTALTPMSRTWSAFASSRDDEGLGFVSFSLLLVRKTRSDAQRATGINLKVCSRTKDAMRCCREDSALRAMW